MFRAKICWRQDYWRSQWRGQPVRFSVNSPADLSEKIEAIMREATGHRFGAEIFCNIVRDNIERKITSPNHYFGFKPEDAKVIATILKSERVPDIE